MSSDIFERGRLTDAVVGYLRQHADVVGFPLLVGDGEVPAEAGWVGRQPGVGDFRPSTTVRTGLARPLHRETLNARHTSWRCAYSIRTIGGARSQADAGADVVRQVMSRFKQVTLTANGPWVVQDAVYEQLGALERRGSLDQATWEVDDVVDLWVVKGR